MRWGLGLRAWGLGILATRMVVPTAVQAQEPRFEFTVGGLAGREIVQSRVDQVNERFTGLLLGAEGMLSRNRFMMRIRYGEGRINPSDGSGDATPREVVEGEALVGVQATPWLSLWLGPSARAYTIGGTDERWLTWTGRASARGTILPGRMQTFVELWGALAGTVGNPSVKARGKGASGGLEARLGRADLWGRLGYRIESTSAEALRETVEALTLSVIYGLPK